MGKIYEYNINVYITDDDAQITARYGSSELSDTVPRDGSFDANFEATMLAHRNAVLSVAPSATSFPCYVTLPSKWFKTSSTTPVGTALTVVSDNATLNVPVGNSGVLVLSLETVTYTVKYSLNGGAFTTIADGATVTVVQGDILKFEAISIAAQDFVNARVLDQDTGRVVDNISLMNSTSAV